MSQLTLYLDDQTADQLRDAAASEGISQSQWVARLIRDRLRSSWPEHLKALAGAWGDFPELEEIREGQGEDLPRDEF